SPVRTRAPVPTSQLRTSPSSIRPLRAAGTTRSSAPPGSYPASAWWLMSMPARSSASGILQPRVTASSTAIAVVSTPEITIAASATRTCTAGSAKPPPNSSPPSAAGVIATSPATTPEAMPSEVTWQSRSRSPSGAHHAAVEEGQAGGHQQHQGGAGEDPGGGSGVEVERLHGGSWEGGGPVRERDPRPRAGRPCGPRAHRALGCALHHCPEATGTGPGPDVPRGGRLGTPRTPAAPATGVPGATSLSLCPTRRAPAARTLAARRSAFARPAELLPLARSQH